MMKKLSDIAKVVRSKNASPFELTLDIIFNNREDYLSAKKKELVNVELIAEIYHIEREKINKVIYFDPALAVKVCLKRTHASGSPGDSDVYGAQQHAPLLSLTLDI